MTNRSRRFRSLTNTILSGILVLVLAGAGFANVYEQWPESTRPSVQGTKYMATGSNPMAIMAGAKILEKGGNAIDAGIAIAAAANIVDGWLSGLGGDCVLLIYDAEEDKVTTIEGLGWSPEKATLDYYMLEVGELPSTGPLSINVPGGFSAWLMAMDRYGTMSLADVFEPAIELAEQGYSITKMVGGMLQSPTYIDHFGRYPSTADIWWKDDGTPYGYGEVIIQKDLANTYKKFVAVEQENLGYGRSAGIEAVHELFYKGEVAEAMAAYVQEYGGILQYEDIANFRATEKPPISIPYREQYVVYQNPPPTQGHTTLQTLNIMEQFDLNEMGRSAEYYHLLTEALKLAFRDRTAFIGDPSRVEVPIDALISKAYAVEQLGRIDMDKAAEWPIEPGNPWKYQEGHAGAEGMLPIIYTDKEINAKNALEVLAMADRNEGIVIGNTQHWCVVDKDRNVFAHTGSINGLFGSQMTVPGYGFLLNNRLNTFHVDPDNPNVLEPRKVVFHTIQNVFVKKDGKPFLVVGTPGGDRQTQGTIQVLLNVIEFGMDIQTAIENARGVNTLMMISRSFPYRVGDGLEMEVTVGHDIIEALRAKGHNILEKPPLSIAGNLSGIVIDSPEGSVSGGSDPRREGYAIGW